MRGSVIWGADVDQSDELDFAESELRLPPPPRVPTMLGMERVLRTPISMAAVDAITIAPMAVAA